MDDPRTFPDADAAPAEFAHLHRLAAASLVAATGQESAALDARLVAALDDLVTAPTGAALARLFATAPSASIYRHLWRLLAQREAAPAPALLSRVFALPVILVAGAESTAAGGATLPAILDDVAAIAALLREHGALSGHQTFALGNALVGADALDLPQLPQLHAWEALDEESSGPRELPAAPIVVASGPEGVHLRFIVGSVLAAPGSTPLRDTGVGRWGMPVAQALARQLAAPGISVLALPRAPQPPAAALAQGRAAQREVAAQLFASHAIRQLRAGVGEPTAVVSAHRVDHPAGGGEVRLSLSSPFDPREAQGFRCPLLPLDRVDDVVKMLTDLLRDCRVADVRVKPGVHGDRDPATGLTLLFKEDGPPAPVAMH